MQCPNSTEGGCRCPDHHPGLTRYAHGVDAQLEPARIPPADPPQQQVCPTCHLSLRSIYHQDICAPTVRLRNARAELKANVIDLRRPAQPWMPRPARHQLRKAA